MIQGFSIRRAGAAVLAVSLVSAAPAAAVNLFSVQQDVQAGRQAASQVERQMPILRDAQVTSYVNAIVRRLAAQAGGPEFAYQAKVVNSREINAFALPGGYIYVNRGLISAARSEAELAGVLAHEIAHVAERHGTEQATKAYGAQAGVGLLAQVLGGRDRRLGVAEQVIGSLGVNAAFMKFSRNAEHEADHVGAQIMSRAGYDPMAMATFFDLLQASEAQQPERGGEVLQQPPPGVGPLGEDPLVRLAARARQRHAGGQPAGGAVPPGLIVARRAQLDGGRVVRVTARPPLRSGPRARTASARR